jgi:hypothetical protein
MFLFETKHKMPKFGLCLQLDKKEEYFYYLEIRKEKIGIFMSVFLFFSFSFEIDT